MKIKQSNDNGNVIVFNRINQQETLNPSHFDNSTWLTTNNQTNSYNTSNSQFHSNSNLYSESESFESDILTTKVDEVNVICNRQYRINSQHYKEKESEADLKSTTAFISRLQGDTNVFNESKISKENQLFTHNHTNEMSEKGLQHMPRGIVNPNYPGFQHLAHTLQDYSSNIENFYQSENEMTDDDIDQDITESSYESEPYHNSESISASICHYNNNNEMHLQSTLLHSNSDLLTHSTLDSKSQNDIPDLLKTVSNNNNNNIQSVDFGCSDNDIENNFQKEDIIGDFNKEIEDEIKILLNYNISIHDDLEELRKDIKETFTEPIENTINNISDVVNQVIKKLVETQSDLSDNQELNILDSQTVQDCIETFVMNKENERNTRTEINLHRPSFLLIEDNINNKIADAFLSDGKDEINIYKTDYDTENLSRNVENTIKQLSTELRKIIPKLEEMREFDKLWTKKKLFSTTIEIDGNSNEIVESAQDIALNSTKKNDQIEISSIESAVLNNGKSSIETSSQKTVQKNTEPVKSSSCTAQRNPSVQKSDISKTDEIGSFDVYNIETALPKIDLDAIENHLRAAKEAARRKRNDREEIRKRLALGIENDEYYSLNYPDRPGKKPSLQSRLQNGKNLQICFMNETASDNESQSDIERSSSKTLSHSSLFSSKSSINHPYQTRPLSVSISKNDKISTVQSSAKLRPSALSLRSKSRSSQSLGHIELKESDFYALQATLQTEARIALAQAKELARIQMERERRCRPVSPVTEMLRLSMEKANAPLAPDRRRVSRQLLTDMNIAQLQVIVNELHSQIESLNDSLVKLLMGRDELHMGQDSMLVDIEDLTRYLGVKEQTKKGKGTKSGVRRLASLVNK